MENKFAWQGSREEVIAYNQQLILRYPWLLPRHHKTGKVFSDYDFTWTLLDDMPDGWRAAFGEEMCGKIQKLLEKTDYVNKYEVLEIKEKYGSLRWYDNGCPREIYDEMEDIRWGYEEKSTHICINCGAPATKISRGWISPWCDECASQFRLKKFMPIEEFYK